MGSIYGQYTYIHTYTNTYVHIYLHNTYRLFFLLGQIYLQRQLESIESEFTHTPLRYQCVLYVIKEDNDWSIIWSLYNHHGIVLYTVCPEEKCTPSYLSLNLNDFFSKNLETNQFLFLSFFIFSSKGLTFCRLKSSQNLKQQQWGQVTCYLKGLLILFTMALLFLFLSFFLFLLFFFNFDSKSPDKMLFQFRIENNVHFVKY